MDKAKALIAAALFVATILYSSYTKEERPEEKKTGTTLITPVSTQDSIIDSRHTLTKKD